ncbi:hypothetical protein C8R44DRAFT_736236 [Mycena epipterygia]|nr:hypothetical protein C8R44DRAFT_736236 [Mycena epipterygia]
MNWSFDAGNWDCVDDGADSGWNHAQIDFGANVPDVTEAWIAQSCQFVSNQTAGRFLVLHVDPRSLAIRTQLMLTREMVLAQETATTPESIALLETVPEELNVFFEVPTLDSDQTAEPHPTSKATSLIPPGASIQEECGFDPRTNAAAKALDSRCSQPATVLASLLPSVRFHSQIVTRSSADQPSTWGNTTGSLTLVSPRQTLQLEARTSLTPTSNDFLNIMMPRSIRVEECMGRVKSRAPGGGCRLALACNDVGVFLDVAWDATVRTLGTNLNPLYEKVNEFPKNFTASTPVGIHVSIAITEVATNVINRDEVE